MLSAAKEVDLLTSNWTLARDLHRMLKIFSDFSPVENAIVIKLINKFHSPL